MDYFAFSWEYATMVLHQRFDLLLIEIQISRKISKIATIKEDHPEHKLSHAYSTVEYQISNRTKTKLHSS